jgi:hypothetical protein
LKNVLKIPTKVVVHKDDTSGVWLKKGGRAHFQKLKIVAIDDKMLAVKELVADAVIIVPSAKKKPLFEGSRVH